jgi:hypothetical protein
MQHKMRRDVEQMAVLSLTIEVGHQTPVCDNIDLKGKLARLHSICRSL